jgi:hypothetical protein
MGLLHLIEELFQHGGVTVETTGARSVFQVDGQIIVKVTPQVLSQPALWAEHLAAFRKRLAPIERLRARLRRVGQVVRYLCGSPLLVLSDTARASSAELGVDVWTVTFLSGPALGVVLSGVTWLLVYRARRHLEKVVRQVRQKAGAPGGTG